MTAVIPYLEQIQTELLAIGRDPDILAGELLDIIADAIANQPRTLQKRIGPSEIGTPCTRKLGYRFLDHPEQDRPTAWKPTIGTAVHEHLAGIFDRYNVDNAAEYDGQERFYVETRLSVGEIAGEEITGSSDLFDRTTLTNWDWKIVGPTQLIKHRTQGPGDQYRTQAHLYGRGWQRAGIGCDTVGVIFLPRNGEFADAHVWFEPYDEQVAVDALRRADGVELAVRQLGHRALTLLDTAPDYCGSCQFFRAGSTDLTTGCPGDPDGLRRDAPALTFNKPNLVSEGV